ncbi:Zinc finger, C2H2 [Artemisia annua]|uniref:Zinc finger, C2H2 n=1 Tax=Artemisia annua TaxID=35608 RepID=A0A2U1PJX9_ARTAN|nr:Zinc finger, C2H2 [Artemisia annua]
MSSQKHGSSDTSSNEKTSPSLSPDRSKDGVGRSYECAFCKRGFTNAQALGEAQYFGASYGFQMGDHCYDQFIPSNPNFPWNFAPTQFNDLATHSEHARVNLNLGIGTSEMVDNKIVSEMVGPEEWFEKEVDLELRLGHYP